MIDLLLNQIDCGCALSTVVAHLKTSFIKCIRYEICSVLMLSGRVGWYCSLLL